MKKALNITMMVVGFLLVFNDPEDLDYFVFNFIGLAMVYFAADNLKLFKNDKQHS